MNQAAIAGALMGLIGAFFYGQYTQRAIDDRQYQVEMTKAIIVSRETERHEQKVVNDAIKKQLEREVKNSASLAIDVERLRKRPTRSVPEAPRPACEGANGPELGGEYAIFLRQFAALATKQDAALEAWQEACDQ